MARLGELTSKGSSSSGPLTNTAGVIKIKSKAAKGSVGPKTANKISQKIKDHMNQVKPGNPYKNGTFLKEYQNEQVIAAYLGFSDLSDFRRFLLSRYMIQGYCVLSSLSKDDPSRKTGRTALEFLGDEREKDQISKIADPHTKWDLAADDNKCRRWWHMAHLLLRLAQSIDGGDAHERLYTTPELLQAFEESLNGVSFNDISKNELPELEAPDNNAQMKAILGPLPSESDVEPFNRIYCALRYLQHIDSSSNLWGARMSKERVKESKLVREDAIPGWMKPSNAPQAPVKKWTALWDPKNNFLGEGQEQGVAAHVSALRAKDPELRIPEFTQAIELDPRTVDQKTWRDGLRTQFRCKAFNLDLAFLALEYVADGKTGEKISEDLKWMTWDKWKETQQLFEVLTQKDDSGMVRVGMKVVDADNEIRESWKRERQNKTPEYWN